MKAEEWPAYFSTAERRVAKAYGRPPWMIGNPTEEELYRESELLEIERFLQGQLPPVQDDSAPPGFEMETVTEALEI